MGDRFALGAAPVAAAGCTVGPNYKPPVTEVPAGYREAINRSPDGPATRPTTDPAAGPTTASTSFADASPAEIRWWRQFGDPQLTDLVEKSVKANYGVAVGQGPAARGAGGAAGRAVAALSAGRRRRVGPSVPRQRFGDRPSGLGLGGQPVPGRLRRRLGRGRVRRDPPRVEAAKAIEQAAAPAGAASC